MDIFDILWDSHQQRRINEAEERLKSASLTASDLQKQLSALRERLDHCNLAMLAQWELVSEKLGLTVDQLRTRIAEIDLRDGVADGRIAGDASVCSDCGREIRADRQFCLYCGSTRRGVSFGE